MSRPSVNKVAAGVNQWGRASRQYGGQLHQIDRLKSDRTEAALFPQKRPKAPGGSTPDRAGTLEPAQTAMINGFVWYCIYVSYEPFFCFVLFYTGGFVECVTAGCAHMRVAHVHLAPQEMPHASLPTVELAQILGVPIGSY